MPSFTARLVALGLRYYLRPRLARQSVEERRRAIDTRVGGSTRRGAQVERLNAGGVPAEWVDIPRPASRAVLYHLHGGGFCAGSCASERPLLTRLARAAGARGFAVDYRLAPEHPFPAAVEDTVAAYRWLLKAGVASADIVLSGSSAGGALALAALVSLRDAGDPLPASCILLSPATDLTLSGESFVTKARADPVLSQEYVRRATRLYIGQGNPKEPLASPLFADLQGLPPLLIHVGSSEILLSDSTRLARRAEEAGVNVTLKVWDGLFHVFHTAGFLPESRRALAEIGAFAEACYR